MCGMVPYVDFADSKGPLLWLIYGVGYLISHHSFIGVFWINIPFLTITLFAAYKLCCLFANKDVSAVSTAALPFFLYFFFIHAEVRPEDFCYPFIMLALYCTCRILKYRDSDARTYFKLSVLMGVCSMCCVLIKYNIGCMIMGLMAVVLYMAIRHKAGWLSFLGMVIGFVVPAVPFVICFLIYGNMGAFVQEYFINTFVTTDIKGQWGISTKKMLENIFLTVFLLIILLEIILFSRKNKLGYWLVPCYLLFIVGLGDLGKTQNYYFAIFMPFTLFIIMNVIIIVLNKNIKLRSHIKLLCCLMAMISIISELAYIYVIRIPKDASISRQNYYKAAYVMAQIKKPTFLLYDVVDCGVGVPANNLPACRYWLLQMGATEEMKKIREECISKRKPDFIIVGTPIKDKNDYERKKKICNRFESLGYIFYCYAPAAFGKNGNSEAISLYGRPGLKLPPEDFHVSQWDVWLKRNIFGI